MNEVPHNFDYVMVTDQVQVADGNVFNAGNLLSEGPDSDEVWDVLDIYVDILSEMESANAQPTAAEVYYQLDTGADLQITAGDLQNGVEASSHRVLWADRGSCEARVEDDTNGEGSGETVFRSQRHFRFDEGDLRIAFPGELTLAGAFRNDLGGGVSALQNYFNMSVHYRPSPRHS